jgi:hypothetical protein
LHRTVWESTSVAQQFGTAAGDFDTFARVSNAGVIEINRSLQRTEFAGLVEVGTFARYFITPRLTDPRRLRIWWIHGVVLAPCQIGSAITQNPGRHLEGTTEIMFYGASAGVEYVW